MNGDKWVLRVNSAIGETRREEWRAAYVALLLSIECLRCVCRQLLVSVFSEDLKLGYFSLSIYPFSVHGNGYLPLL